MLISPIVNQLAATLPNYTNLFSDQVSVISLTRIGTEATAITSVNHGFVVGQYVNITGAIELVPIIQLTFDINTGQATARSTLNNNLSQNFDFNTKLPRSQTVPQVTVAGADQSEYNGTFDLISVPNRNAFIYQIVGSPVTPATGSPVLYSYAYNYFVGVKQITSVPSTTSFTYNISDNASLSTAGTILAHSNIRISGSATDQRALESYTKQSVNKYWLFITGGESVTSKNREILNDAITNRKSGSAVEYRLRLVDDVGFLIFAPTRSEVSGLQALDTIEGEVKVAIFKSILNFPALAQYDAESDFVYNYLEGSLLEYDAHPAYLVYKMSFGVNFDVTYYDTFIPNVYAPLLNIDMTFDVEGGQLLANIDLDEDPEF